MKMSRGKRNVLFAGVLSCAMLFGIGNTMAYFTENSVQTNVFTTGDLDIGLKEPDWDPNENDGKNMYPGIHGIQKSNCKEHHLRQKRGRALLCENECGHSE